MIVFAFGCGRVGFDPHAVDAPLGPWSSPVPIPALSTAFGEEDVTGASTKTELIFRLGAAELYTSTRATTDDAWGPPQALVDVNTTNYEAAPRLSQDDLTLYFQSNRPGGAGLDDVWMTTRASIGAAWGPATNVGFVNTAAIEKWLTVCDANHYMVVRVVAGKDTVFQGVLGSAPSPVPELNTGSESGVELMADCLTVYFNSNRNGSSDIFVATRPTIADAWGLPVLMPDVNLPQFGEQDPWMSPDQRLFTFSSDRAGTTDIYMMTR